MKKLLILTSLLILMPLILAEVIIVKPSSNFLQTSDLPLENKTLVAYQNITNIPICSGTDKLTFDGSILSCATDQDSGADIYVNETGDTMTGLLTIKTDGSAFDVQNSSGTSVLFVNTSNKRGYLYNTPNGSSDIKSIVNKEYVDLAVTSLGAAYYMYNSTDATGYKLCYLDPSSDSEFYDEYSSLTDDLYLDGWISATGKAPQKLLKGVYGWFITLEKTTGTKTLRVYWKLYERKSDDSEVLVATSSLSNEIDGRSTYLVPLQLDADYLPSDGSRIVGKLYASVSGGGNAPTLRVYYQGSTSSRWEIPANTEIFKNIFVPYTGAVQNVDLGNYDLTVDSGTLFVDSANDRVGIGTTSPGGYKFVINTSDDAKIRLYEQQAVAGGSDVLILFGAGTGTDGHFVTIGQDANDGFVVRTYVAGWQDRFFVAKGGNVGVGTTSPGQTGWGRILEIYSPDDQAGLRINASGNANIDLISNDTNAKWWRIISTTDAWNADNGSLMFRNQNDALNAMVINPSGNVGIGTTSPGYKLEVNDDILVNGTAGEVYFDSSSYPNLWKISQSGSGCPANDLCFYDVTNNKLPLNLEASTGNVGIGTTEPRGHFDVDGSGHIWLTDDGLQAGTQNIYLAGHIYLVPYSGGDIAYLQARRSDDSGTTALRLRTYNAGSLTEAVHIAGNGNVGIGTTSPSHKLHVNGNIAGHAFLDVTCATFKEFSTEELLKILDIQPREDGIYHKSEPDSPAFKHIDFSKVHDKIAVIAKEDRVINQVYKYDKEKKDYVKTELHYKKGEKYGIDFGSLVYAIAETVLRLNQKIEELKAENDKLKATLCDMGRSEWC